MAATKNRLVDRFADQELREYPVKAGVRIFKGTFVVLEKASGYVKPFVTAANAGTNNLFAGVAYEEADNTGGSNGDKKVSLFAEGDFEHAIASGSITDVGAKVYASDDDALGLVPGASADNVFVGRAQQWLTGTTFVVRLHGAADADAT